MTARERLFAARQARTERCYEDALTDLVWLHDHALEENRAWYAVRLSYALFEWIELGRVCPPARQALEAVRDRKTDSLLRGKGDGELFHDVVSINEVLQVPGATHALYLALDEHWPALASQYAGLALPAIVAVKDYALAARIRPAPEALIRERAARLSRSIASIKHQPYHPAPMRWSGVKSYADLVKRHLAITAGIGDEIGARRLHALAVDAIHSPPLRAQVRTAIARREDLPRLYRRGWARAGRKLRRK